MVPIDVKCVRSFCFMFVVVPRSTSTVFVRSAWLKLLVHVCCGTDRRQMSARSVWLKRLFHVCCDADRRQVASLVLPG